MRKSLKIISLITALTTVISIGANSAVSVSAYDGQAAANYAKKWTKNNSDHHNTWFEYYPNRDCTNFVSQCLANGGMKTDNDKTKDKFCERTNPEKNLWYHKRCKVQKKLFEWTYQEYIDWKVSSTWTVASKTSKNMYGLNQYFYINRNKLTDGMRKTNSKWTKYDLVKEARIGDIIQAGKKGDSDPSHSVIVTGKTKDGDLLVTYHSNNKKDVKFLDYFSKYDWSYYYLIKIKR